MDQCQILMGNFSLNLYPIDFKTSHNDPLVLKMNAMNSLGIHSCSTGFIQDFLDHYADECWSNDVDVGRNP